MRPMCERQPPAAARTVSHSSCASARVKGPAGPRRGAGTSVAWIMADIKLPWSSGKDASSRRVGYLYRMDPELYGVKWRNFKLALTVQNYLTDPVGKLPFPHIINLTADPQEREPLNSPPHPRARPWTSSPPSHPTDEHRQTASATALAGSLATGHARAKCPVMGGYTK